MKNPNRKIFRFCAVGLLAWLVAGFAPQRYPVIYMIGDSTMADKPIDHEKPERGWGQMLPGYLDARIVVDNHAMNGRSSRSFLDEGRWTPILEKLKPGDYVFIQFGHNDQKVNTKRYAAADGLYRENLKKYIDETRAKGGIPVLFTSIARRHFDEAGKLIDTHTGYTEAVFAVGKEMNVPVIDLNKATTDMILSVPQEESKKFFMWIEKETNPSIPNGREDNTHLNVYGGRVVAGMAADSIARRLPDLAPFVRKYDFVVARDGSGDFMTVQEAIDAVPDMRKGNRTTVYIRNGIYKEKLVLPASKQNVTFLGEDPEKTVLCYDDYASKKNRFGEAIGTSGSASFYVYGDGFVAENITFRNTAGPVGQAVAIFTEGDRLAFRNCRFLGFQDTLYTHGDKSRQYYKDCYIEGTVDFIFGWSTAVFDGCTIHAKRSGGYLTAASTSKDTKYGYVFLGCKLTADEGVENVYLGRPWRPYAKTVFIGCEMDGFIAPAGWHNWGKTSNEKTAYYAEYGNTGPGAAIGKRVKWDHILTAKEAAQYTVENVLSGPDGWQPLNDEFRPKER